MQNFPCYGKIWPITTKTQHRGKCKRKKAEAAFGVFAELFILTMASVTIQGYYDISTVVSELLLLCSVPCVCVLCCCFS